ncbi:MAG TPA: hypothetical protein VGK29_14005 [Paludibaculum sp.]|jgi:hypothetical protein
MRLVLSVAVSSLLMAAGMFAQMQPRLVADIPFDFYVGDKTFPKGTYELTLQRSTVSGIVLLQSVSSIGISGAALAHVASLVPATYLPPVMVFKKYDDDHLFLKAARWSSGAQLSMELGQSRTERDLSAPKLVTQRAPETLTILARAR